jgi:hypothetical protein
MVVAEAGIEPATFGLWARRATAALLRNDEGCPSRTHATTRGKSSASSRTLLKRGPTVTCRSLAALSRGASAAQPGVLSSEIVRVGRHRWWWTTLCVRTRGVISASGPLLGSALGGFPFEDPSSPGMTLSWTGKLEGKAGVEPATSDQRERPPDVPDARSRHVGPSRRTTQRNYLPVWFSP